MLLFISLLIISQILTVYTNLAAEKKFINDLKGDAKKEFIDRVVRRLAQEVDLQDVPTEESKKMSDDQLDKHSDFVKQIINEEKTNYEKDIHDKIQNREESEPRRLSNQSHIDLTLKEQTRKKRNENSDSVNRLTTEVNEVTIPVETVYDVDPNRGIRSKVNESLREGKDDIQVKGQKPNLRRSGQKKEILKQVNGSLTDNSTDSDNLNGDIDKTVPLDKSKESNEVKSVTEGIEDKKPTVSSLENTEKIESTIEETTVKEDGTSIKLIDKTRVETTTFDNGELSDQNKVLKDSKRDSKYSNEDYLKDSHSATVTPEVTVTDVTLVKNFTTLATNTEKTLLNVTEKLALRDDSLVQSTLTPESKKEAELHTEFTTISVPETTTLKAPKTVAKFKKTVNNVKRNKINDLTLTYNPYKFKHVERNKASKLRSEEVKIVKVGPSGENILRSRLPTIHLKNILDRNNPMEIDDDINTLQIAEDVVKALRIGIDKDVKNQKIALRKKPNVKQKQVKIYGLRSFFKDESLKNDEDNREEPYYAPVYNYNPNNAYYNAYNKYGPNYEDSKQYKTKEPEDANEFMDLLNLSSEQYSRSFFKRPAKLSKKIVDGKRNSKNVIIDSILPFVVKKPYKLPQNDYEEFLEERDIKEKNSFRFGSIIKEIDESLKNHLRLIREDIHLRNKTKNKHHLKDGSDNRGGWLDDRVTYYIENLKNKAKPVNSQKGFHSINYDYIGEIQSEKNEKLRHDPKLTSKSVKTSREVITRIKKIKSKSESKELVGTFQKVFPLLKNLVQIVDDDTDEEVEACIKVLRDMINRDDEGLEQYDWLESTVNIQSAIKKLLDLTRAAIEGLRMHPSDKELLKYTTVLFSAASDKVQNGAPSLPSLSTKSPKSKAANANHRQVWIDSTRGARRAPYRKMNTFDYGSLRRFLNDLSDSLFDLHDALKHVSSVTNFKSQRWYRNLKDLYLHDPDRKKLLEVILHLSTTKLFNLIEDSTRNGADEDFERFILDNQSMVSVVQDAFVFVIKVLQAAMYSR